MKLTKILIAIWLGVTFWFLSPAFKSVPKCPDFSTADTVNVYSRFTGWRKITSREMFQKIYKVTYR